MALNKQTCLGAKFDFQWYLIVFDSDGCRNTPFYCKHPDSWGCN